MAALVFDYRCFGSSDGEPRQLFDNRSQLADWRAAIECARRLDGVDPDRIALWGTSTSGGHVVRLAAEDQEIAAVVVQVPLVDGLAQLLSTPLLQSVRLLWAGLKDQIRAILRPLFNLKLHTIPAAGRPGTLAAVTSPDALSGLARITPCESTWRNETLARFTLKTAFYRPGLWARRLRCPLLVCLADGDLLIPAKPALRMVRAAPRGELRRYPVGHFTIYFGDAFKRAVSHQTAFLSRCLNVSSATGNPAPEVPIRAEVMS
jgi:pimeloyl-ACP methyl ester carboxylesterase